MFHPYPARCPKIAYNAEFSFFVIDLALSFSIYFVSLRFLCSANYLRLKLFLSILLIILLYSITIHHTFIFYLSITSLTWLFATLKLIFNSFKYTTTRLFFVRIFISIIYLFIQKHFYFADRFVWSATKLYFMLYDSHGAVVYNEAIFGYFW